MEKIYFSETLVSSWESERPQNQEEKRGYPDHRENLKFSIIQKLELITDFHVFLLLLLPKSLIFRLLNNYWLQ
jgi:hypothetical protein